MRTHIRAYLRAEGTIMVVDDATREYLIEFEPVRKGGKVTGNLPVRLGGEMLDAVRDCYKKMGFPPVSMRSWLI